jgi:tetratricopeptide (TPR) repeat protein
MRRVLIVAALLFAVATPAHANGLADIHAADQAAQKQDWGKAVRLYTHALADYGAAIKLSPQCGACYNNRGMARNQTGDYDGAIADFTAALQYEQHDPDLWQVYFNRGIAWYHKNDNDRAIADYDQAIKLNARCAPCFHDRGMAWQDKGDLAKSNDDLNTADQLAH